MRKRITPENATDLTRIQQVRSGWITDVTWSPDGDTLAIAGAAGVRLYVGSFGGMYTHALEGHEGNVKGASFSLDGKYIVSAGADMVVKLWDTSDLSRTPARVASLTMHSDSVDGVAFSPDSLSFATCSADSTIILWDVRAKTPRAILHGHDGEVASVTFGLNGNVVVSGGRDNTVRMWDVSGETRGTVIGEHEDWVREVRRNRPGTLLATASKDSTVRVWDAHSGEQRAVIRAHSGGADTVAFSPDGKLLATGGRDDAIRIWDVTKLLDKGEFQQSDALITLTEHARPVLCLAFNPTGTLLASGSGDNTVRLWSAGVTESGAEEDPREAGKTALLGDLPE
jgi:WD40 repeat protein